MTLDEKVERVAELVRERDALRRSLASIDAELREMFEGSNGIRASSRRTLVSEPTSKIGRAKAAVLRVLGGSHSAMTTGQIREVLHKQDPKLANSDLLYSAVSDLFTKDHVLTSAGEDNPRAYSLKQGAGAVGAEGSLST